MVTPDYKCEGSDKPFSGTPYPLPVTGSALRLLQSECLCYVDASVVRIDVATRRLYVVRGVQNPGAKAFHRKRGALRLDQRCLTRHVRSRHAGPGGEDVEVDDTVGVGAADVEGGFRCAARAGADNQILCLILRVV